MKEPIKTEVYKQELLPLYICDVTMDFPTTPWLNIQKKLSGSAWPMHAWNFKKP